MEMNNLFEYKEYKSHWRKNPDNDKEKEWTVGKLIMELQKYDPDTVIRIAHDGYENREIYNVEEGDEGFWDDDENRHTYKIVNIFGM